MQPAGREHFSSIYAAEAEGRDTRTILNDVTRHVVGMDLHPVAVTLARVTYLLAIGRTRLTDPNRGNIQIPVYLGDSIQWREQNLDLWSAGHLVINTDEQRTLFGSELSFPDALLGDAANFDKLVNELTDRASKRKPDSPVPSLKALFSRFTIPEEHRAVIEATFKTMCHLHDVGRDHIWGYYIRNLARPLWLSRPGNQVDMLVGNPPWLAYSHMTPEMQGTFRSMSDRRGLWAGAKLSPHQDLSALFVVRACELYLRKGGQFALVLPNAALDREHYAGFRTGTYSSDLGVLTLSFGVSWDLRRLRPHFFPRASSVVFGTRIDDSMRRDRGEQAPTTYGMPEEVEIWTGRLEAPSARWDNTKAWLKRVPGKVRRIGQLEKSPYAPRFTQGATFVPRLAFVVSKTATSSLGLSQGNTSIESHRTVLEKKPWKNLPSISGVVESRFIRPFFTGDNIYPFTIGKPMLAVLPCDDVSLIDPDRLDLYPGLQQWWSRANQLWEANRASERLTLLARLDYQATLSKQLPIPPLRVVYNRSGMHVCAAKLHNQQALVTSGLYWAPVLSEAEADYICGIINAPITTELTRPMMSYGKDERDIHKHIWELPIPEFDSTNDVHRQISSLAAFLERKIADGFRPNETVYFAATRRHIRDFIMHTSEGLELNELVLDLIS